MAKYNAASERVCSFNFLGSCGTVIACWFTIQYVQSYSSCKATKFFIAPM